MTRNFCKTQLNSVIEINKIITLHYFDYVKDFQGIGESHDFWEFVYVDSGQIEVVANDKKYTLHQGEAVFHQPNEYHNVFALGSFASVFIVSFECMSQGIDFFCKKILTLSNVERDLIAEIFKEGKKAFVEPFDIIDQTKLIRKKNATYGAEQLVKNQLEHLFISLVRNNTDGSGSSQQFSTAKIQNDQRIVDTIITILSGNIYRKITLNEVCSRIAFSKSYIEKLFKEKTGCGIIEYYNKIKINEAKRLISEGKYSFTQISQMLNFESIHYFSRTFKHYTCMSPTNYEKSVKARSLL
ncbi:AraC family transcriptional regulator [Caproiciproducens sp.]|uniref:AraC family transcriptional regulator n=1 Tax=Caproiciproducens sp. TaxID=1954376 RepID=UPI00289B1AAF|nr:AraC family transcriptional regulator [Caproiciproducens sp.]